MDHPFAASLLLHPSRRALVMLDAAGEVLAGNERASELMTPDAAAATPLPSPA